MRFARQPFTLVLSFAIGFAGCGLVEPAEDRHATFIRGVVEDAALRGRYPVPLWAED